MCDIDYFESIFIHNKKKLLLFPKRNESELI